MNVNFTGRQMDVSNELRIYTETKLKKLHRFIDGITDIHVILSREKYRQIAEVNVHSRGNSYLTAIEESNDLKASIAQAIDKIQAQGKKHRAKRIGKRRRAGRRESSGTFNVLVAEEGTASSTGPRIIESRRFVIKPLSVEEAVAEMEEGTAEFLVFRNAANERANVIYRRPDGNYGLIDPEAQ
ncbi:MAG: ribosome hibernation-promoting factor, HPF/YfiA family [Acidobacteriota bacterium]